MNSKQKSSLSKAEELSEGFISKLGKFLSKAPNDCKVLFNPITSTETVYVQQDGNDSSGDGSIGSPFLTLSYALSQITDASSSKHYIIRLGGGTFIESTLSLKAWVWIFGNNQSASKIIVSSSPNNVNIDSSWSTQNSRGGLTNVYLSGVTNLNLDVQSIGGGYSRVFEISNVQMNGNLIFTGVSTADFIQYFGGVVFGNIHFSGGQNTLLQIICGGNAVFDTINSNSLLQIFGLLINGTTTFTSNGVYTNQITMNASNLSSTLIIDQANTNLSSDCASLPLENMISITNSGVLTRLTDANSIEFTTVDSTKWFPSVPTTISTALDNLSNGIFKSLTSNTTLTTNQGHKYGVSNINTNTVLDTTQYICNVSGNVSLTLPLSTSNVGTQYVILVIPGNTVTLISSIGDTIIPTTIINGGSSVIVTSNGNGLWFVK